MINTKVIAELDLEGSEVLLAFKLGLLNEKLLHNSILCVSTCEMEVTLVSCRVI